MGCVRFPLVAALIALMPTLAFAYTLGPGDQLAVEVRTAQTELSLEMAVSADGRIYIDPAGVLTAEGKTPAELEADIARGLSRYYVGPVQVAVLVTTPKQVKVSVLGQVKQPGEQELLDDRPLLSQAIAKAGGPLPQASERRVSLVRGGRELGPINLYAILKLGRGELDVELRPDDVICVPAREQWATVLGPVYAPGIYELLPGDRVSDLVVMAGGLAADADQERAIIQRHSGDGGARTVEIRLRAALAGPGGADDPPLESGDTVRLAGRVNQVYVLGEVQEPGAKPYEDNRALLDYIGFAGGTTARAMAHKAAIVRPGNPEPKVTPVNLAELMAGHAKAPPPQLQPGDIIYVPGRRVATAQDWASIGQVLATLIAGYRIF